MADVPKTNQFRPGQGGDSRSAGNECRSAIETDSSAAEKADAELVAKAVAAGNVVLNGQGTGLYAEAEEAIHLLLAALQARPAEPVSDPYNLVGALRAIVTLRRHSREDDADNAQTMQDMAEAALVKFEKTLSGPGTAQHPTATDWRNRAERAEAECKELLAKLERVLTIFPSGAGMQDQPDSKVIAFYITLREIRALKAVAGEIV